jgi:hypothetical protein
MVTKIRQWEDFDEDNDIEEQQRPMKKGHNKIHPTKQDGEKKREKEKKFVRIDKWNKD